jgi:hypothetical protein
MDDRLLTAMVCALVFACGVWDLIVWGLRMALALTRQRKEKA